MSLKGSMIRHMVTEEKGGRWPLQKETDTNTKETGALYDNHGWHDSQRATFQKKAHDSEGGRYTSKEAIASPLKSELQERARRASFRAPG